MLSVEQCCCNPVVGTPKTFTGCSGLILANYQIRIRSASGGTILETFTTDASGVANITSTGTKWVESTDGRFSGASLVLSSATLALSGGVNTGTYICLPCCAIPVTKVMTFTSTKFGSFTGNWLGTGGFSITGCGPCTYPVTVIPSLQGTTPGADCTGVVTVSQIAATNCPANFGGGSTTCANIGYTGSVSMTCPPSFSWSGVTQIATTPGALCLDRATGCGTYPWNDTMTATE